jgi:hypothetical protein
MCLLRPLHGHSSRVQGGNRSIIRIGFSLPVLLEALWLLHVPYMVDFGPHLPLGHANQVLRLVAGVQLEGYCVEILSLSEEIAKSE